MTATETADLGKAINEIGEDALAISDYGNLLQEFTSRAEIRSIDVPGLYRLVCQMIEHAENLKTVQQQAREIMKSSANS